MKPYLYYEGLVKAAKSLKGTENVYLAIRPYGFHAGNMLPMVAYPILLCKEMVKLGKTPRFNFILFINDWEQDKLQGPDLDKYPLDYYPSNTTFRHVYLPNDEKVNMADYWTPKIAKEIGKIRSRFPGVTISPTKTSSMKYDKRTKKYILTTIAKPEILSNILGKYARRCDLKDNNIPYAMAVCPECRKTIGRSSVINKDLIKHTCTNCGKNTVGSYDSFDYWFHYVPMTIPKYELHNIDLVITGGDHYHFGDNNVLKELAKAYRSKIHFPKTIYSPIVIGYNDLKMGKSKSNAVNISLNKILKLATCKNKQSIIIHEKPKQ